MRALNANDLLKVAVEAAVSGGKLARGKFSQPLQVSNKGFRDFVTDADLATQDIITRTIRDAFPDHGFLTEEEDSTLPVDGPVIWIIDPIDGTTNYSRQMPLFCVSIAAVLNRPPLSDEDVLAGVIYDPMQDELFSAAADGESRLNGRVMRASRHERLGRAEVALDWNHTPFLRQTTLDTVARLAHDVDGLRSLSSAALALAWVAAGRLDGYFNFSLKPWDVAAGSLLVRQAGGWVSDLANQAVSYAETDMECLASNGRLHEKLLSYLPAQIFKQE